ncbi:hypothetical protein Tco_1425001, partial [Tanacetum coccineum]
MKPEYQANCEQKRISRSKMEEPHITGTKPFARLAEEVPKFKGYGPKSSKSVCIDTSNEVKKTPDTSLVEELVSEKEKQTIFPTKIEFLKQQVKISRKPVK